MRVAVVGADWAGLAAAVELTTQGANVTLIEAGRVAGGRARGVEIAGHRLDNGQHILLGAYRDTLALMRRVGIDPEQVLERLPLQVRDNSGFRLTLPRLPAPLHVAAGLLLAQGVSLGEKIRTALWMQGVKFRRFRLSKDCTVAEWLDAAGQTRTLRRHLWEPLCLAALNTPAERASAQIFANVLRDSLGSSVRTDTDLLLPRVNFAELLPEPTLAWLRQHGAAVRFSQRVRAVNAENARVLLDGEAFDAAILAVAPQHLPALWPAAAAPTKFEPIATAYLQYAPEQRLPFPLFNLIGKHGQWVVDRGQGLLACVLSGQGAWNELADDDLVIALSTELQASGLTSKAPHWHRVIREHRATFSCTPNLERIPGDSGHPRVRLAGDHTWPDYPATLEGAVRSGVAAARDLSATTL